MTVTESVAYSVTESVFSLRLQQSLFVMKLQAFTINLKPGQICTGVCFWQSFRSLLKRQNRLCDWACSLQSFRPLLEMCDEVCDGVCLLLQVVMELITSKASGLKQEHKTFTINGSGQNLSVVKLQVSMLLKVSVTEFLIESVFCKILGLWNSDGLVLDLEMVMIKSLLEFVFSYRL